MKKIREKGWFIWIMVLLALLFNIIVISVSNNNQNVLWLLVVSIPLLFLAMHNAWHANRYLSYSINSYKDIAQKFAFRLVSHSIYPNRIAQDDFNVVIGNDQCSQPFTACMLTIGTTRNVTCNQKFRQISNEQLAGNSFHSEEQIATNSVDAKGSVWQIDSSYKGCKTENGNFDSAAFKRIACRPEVKMIEIKLAAHKNSDNTKGSNLAIIECDSGKSHCSIFSESAFVTFCDPEALVHFVENIRNLSGGKPVGIRLSTTAKKEFRHICHATRKIGIIPDFIVFESAGENARSNDLGLHFSTGIPLYEAISFASQTLQMYALEKEIKVIAAGKINSGFEILKLLALGANLVSAEIAEFAKDKYGNMNEAKFQFWINDLQNRLMKDFTQIMNVSGLRNLNDISLSKFFSRLDVLDSKGHITPAGQILDSGIGNLKYIRKAKKLEPK